MVRRVKARVAQLTECGNGQGGGGGGERGNAGANNGLASGVQVVGTGAGVGVGVRGPHPAVAPCCMLTRLLSLKSGVSHTSSLCTCSPLLLPCTPLSQAVQAYAFQGIRV